ncbi:MAG: hypothetical protein KC486_04675 [Myxococcales bacterium]|nr:hypothetical protein [Myxococcales bacterium]
MSDGSDGSDERLTFLDRVMRAQGRGGSAATILMIVGVAGVLFGASGLLSIARQPWDLDAASPVAESIDSDCGPFTGGAFIIDVDGESLRCGGSDTKCGWEGPVAVAYDPDAPARCRVASNVDRLSDYERNMLVLDLVFLLAFIAGASYRRSEALRMADIVDGGAARLGRRRRLRRIAGLCLVAAALGGNLFALLFVLGAG